MCTCMLHSVLFQMYFTYDVVLDSISGGLMIQLCNNVGKYNLTSQNDLKGHLMLEYLHCALQAVCLNPRSLFVLELY